MTLGRVRHPLRGVPKTHRRAGIWTRSNIPTRVRLVVNTDDKDASVRSDMSKRARESEENVR